MGIFRIFLALLLLIPSLAFANQRVQKTDQQWRDQLISQPWVSQFSIMGSGLTGTETKTFQKSGNVNSHMVFNYSTATSDANATWSVRNGVLNFHLINITHSDTHNKKLNTLLDDYCKKAMANPDYSIDLNTI